MFGSINRRQLLAAHTLNKQGIGIIDNKNYFATRLLMHSGPYENRRDLDHKNAIAEEFKLRNICNRNDYAEQKNHKRVTVRDNVPAFRSRERRNELTKMHT